MSGINRMGARDVEVLGEDAVRELSSRLDVAQQVVGLQGSAALREAMSLTELDAERSVEELRREVARRHAVWQIRREVRARRWSARLAPITQWAERRGLAADSREESSDRRWHARAQRERRRLTSADARISGQMRAAARWSRTLVVMMALGMAYTGLTVQANFWAAPAVGDPRWWLAAAMEAMASVALMGLMQADQRAAAAGLRRSGRQAAGGWLVKVLLLAASLLAAAGPAVMSGDLMAAVAAGWAPVLVAGVMLIHAHITSSDAAALAALYRVGDREALRDYVVIAEWATREGVLAPSQDNREGESAPSASRLAAYLHVSKPVAGEIRALLNARLAA